jgi:NodT family efflux transporter outer membrane factor (OMF) lipoprotein
VGADLEPSVGVGLDATRQRANFIGFPIGGAGGVPSATFETFGVSLETSWEVDLWGRVRAGARAAVAEMQASEADLRGARLSIAAQTAKIWFSILEARQQIALAEESVESFVLSAEQVRSRYESGIRPALDLRLALSNLAGAEALLELRRTQLDRAVRQLEVLLGRYPDGNILETLVAGGLPRTPDPVPAGLPSELLIRRPDLVAAERRLVASDQRYLAARRSLYPRLTLTASGGTRSASLNDLLDGDFKVWSLLGGLTQPLFQGGRLRAGVEQADAASRETLSFYVGSVLSAFAEVESSLAAEGYLAEREVHLAEAAEQLVAARRLAEQRYRNGVGIYLVVLESQTRALTAESELLVVRRQRLENRVDLHLALGGGFEIGATGRPDSDRETS